LEGDKLKYVVIADDLTGANATGSLLKKLKLKTVTLMDCTDRSCVNRFQSDATVCSTDSRGMTQEEAYDKVFATVQNLKDDGVKVYNKRIDSTLRGNLGAEIDAILDGLEDNRIAVIVPAFPDAQRIAVGGYLLVNGMPLQESDAAKDPKKPINTSIIEDLVKEQTKYEIGTIKLDIVCAGQEAIKKSIIEISEKGKRLIILDAVTNNDLDNIAKALVETGIKFVTIDSGPFTAAVTKEYERLGQDLVKNKKVLMAIGSITNTTKVQLERVTSDLDAFKVDIITERLINEVDEREAEISRVVGEIVSNQNEGRVLCVAIDSINPDTRVNLDEVALVKNTTKESLSLIINDSIAEISSRILKAVPDINGIFSSGGDISVGVCKKFKSAGLELIGEVIPLAAYGKLIGGDFPELSIVSKGGMVGDVDGMKICVKYLLDAINM
jgi:uncharacterized protein YgbK (DUF1537 family)